MITGVHHTGLVIRHLDAGITFFSQGADFKVISRSDVADTLANRTLFQAADATGRVALLKGTLGCIKLFEFAVNAGGTSRQPDIFEAGIRHICLQGGMDDTLFDRMVARGASAHAPMSGLGTGNLYAYVRDGEGNPIEIEGVPWKPSDVARAWYAHTAIVTPDIDRLSVFYAMVTGSFVHRRGTFGPDHKFDVVGGFRGARFHGAWIRAGNAELEFWQYATPLTEVAPRRVVTDPGWSHVCFERDDLDGDVERLRSAGVEFHAPIGEFGSARVSFCRDPDGNVIELVQADQGSAVTVVDRIETGDGPRLRAAKLSFYAPSKATR